MYPQLIGLYYQCPLSRDSWHAKIMVPAIYSPRGNLILLFGKVFVVVRVPQNVTLLACWLVVNTSYFIQAFYTKTIRAKNTKVFWKQLLFCCVVIISCRPFCFSLFICNTNKTFISTVTKHCVMLGMLPTYTLQLFKFLKRS